MRTLVILLTSLLAILSTSKTLAEDLPRERIRTAKVEELPQIAQHIVSVMEIRRIGVQGAPQVSQLVDEARIQLDLIQVRQNAEMIRLLKAIAKEP